MTSPHDIDKINDIVSSTKFAIVTTRTRSGELHSRPLASLEKEFDGTLWFFTEDPSAKTEDIAADKNVSVTFVSGMSSVSIAGTAEVTRDQEMIDTFWNPWAESWFDGGRTDPTVALLRIEASTATYWSTDKPAVIRAVEVVKALITHSAPDVGESKTVEL
ncbi:MAG: pyridoxamine 5'-phosphate oxidase family protein [Microbacteriaceae bacterium]